MFTLLDFRLGNQHFNPAMKTVFLQQLSLYCQRYLELTQGEYLGEEMLQEIEKTVSSLLEYYQESPSPYLQPLQKYQSALQERMATSLSIKS